MFLSKVKVAMTVVLAAAVLVSGSGLLMSRAGGPDTPDRKSQASPPDVRESNAASPESGAKVTANPSEILTAYQNNAALFDEMFNGKRITVTGKMLRIKGSGIFYRVDRKTGKSHPVAPPGQFVPPPVQGDAAQGYSLEMSVEGSSQIPAPLVRFQFAPDDRKELARLKSGQQVTIEGEPRPQDQHMFQFLNCKIINPKTND